MGRGVAAFGKARVADATLVERTTSGALITIAALLLGLLLVSSELHEYRHPPVEQTLTVDTRRRDLMRLVFNVTFPAMPCAALHVDTADASGEHASDAAPLAQRSAQSSGGQRVRGGELHLARLSAAGEKLGGEYRRPPIEHVRVHGFTFPRTNPADAAALDAAFDAGEGCNVAGWFLVQKVAGSLRFSPHMDDYLATRAARQQLSAQIRARLDAAVASSTGPGDVLPHILRLVPDYSRLNMGHRIHTLSFAAAGVEVPAVGARVPGKGGRAGRPGGGGGPGATTSAEAPSPSSPSSKDAPGHAEPASGLTSPLNDEGTGSFKYYATVVATDVAWRGPHADRAAKAGRPLPPQRTYQYSLSRSFVPLSKRPAMPSVAFVYDTSPLVLHLAPSPRALAHLAVRLCAVLGGLWALASFADRWVHVAVTGVRSAGVAAAAARAANAARTAGYMGGPPLHDSNSAYGGGGGGGGGLGPAPPVAHHHHPASTSYAGAGGGGAYAGASGPSYRPAGGGGAYAAYGAQQGTGAPPPQQPHYRGY